MLSKLSHLPSPLLSHGWLAMSVMLRHQGLRRAHPAQSSPLLPSSSGSEEPGMEFRFSTHQSENSARGILDWL